jgi:hypothetical protein
MPSRLQYSSTTSVLSNSPATKPFPLTSRRSTIHSNIPTRNYPNQAQQPGTNNKMPTPLTTAMRQTTDAFIHAWELWRVDPIMAVRAPECIISQFPTSLQIPDRNNDDFRKWFGGVEDLLSNCKVSNLVSKAPRKEIKVKIEGELWFWCALY